MILLNISSSSIDSYCCSLSK